MRHTSAGSLAEYGSTVRPPIEMASLTARFLASFANLKEEPYECQSK